MGDLDRRITGHLGRDRTRGAGCARTRRGPRKAPPGPRRGRRARRAEAAAGSRASHGPAEPAVGTPAWRPAAPGSPSLSEQGFCPSRENAAQPADRAVIGERERGLAASVEELRECELQGRQRAGLGGSVCDERGEQPGLHRDSGSLGRSDDRCLELVRCHGQHVHDARDEYLRELRDPGAGDRRSRPAASAGPSAIRSGDVIPPVSSRRNRRRSCSSATENRSSNWSIDQQRVDRAALRRPACAASAARPGYDGRILHGGSGAATDLPRHGRNLRGSGLAPGMTWSRSVH